MRQVEIRLLEGPNVYRLEPVVKVEVAIGRRRTWYGKRAPGRHALVRLAAVVPRRGWPGQVEGIVDWTRRLRVEHGEGRGGVLVHRSSDPGHWIVTFPWTGAERAHTIAEAALALAERDVSPARRARLTGAQERILARWQARIAEARATPPTWIRDADRRIPVVSITGTNGKSTVTRLITHILVKAGRRVGTTTSDGVLVNERLIDPGDWTGPGGALQILGRSDLDVAVLETARGGLVLKGMGYESNEVSVVTNVTSDHLDLQGIHTLPELAEVKATVARVTKPDGWSVLNADDPYVAATARRVRSHVALFSLVPGGSAAVRRNVAAGGRGYVVRDGWVVELRPKGDKRIVELARIPITIGGIARHNVANALAAAGAARGLGASIAEVADGLVAFRPTSDRSPGRLNLYRLGARIVIVDFAHNEAGRVRGPRRRGGDRRRCGRSGGADHGDRRHGRRPARRHPARDRPDRRETGPAGRDQGDAEVPSRPIARVDRRRAARGREGSRRGDIRRPDLRVGDRGAQGGAGRLGRATARRRPPLPRGARGGIRAARVARRAADRRRHGADLARAAAPGAPAAGIDFRA